MRTLAHWCGAPRSDGLDPVNVGRFTRTRTWEDAQVPSVLRNSEPPAPSPPRPPRPPSSHVAGVIASAPLWFLKRVDQVRFLNTRRRARLPVLLPPRPRVQLSAGRSARSRASRLGPWHAGSVTHLLLLLVSLLLSS